jgi:hypothetical protein
MTLPTNKNTFQNLFPTIKIDGIKIQDLWRAWSITTELKDKIKVFGTYLLGDGDRWDTIAEEVLGTRELWWVLLLFNNIEDPFSIYFDKTIPNVLKTIKIPREQDIGLILNEIRRIRLKLELENEEEV